MTQQRHRYDHTSRSTSERFAALVQLGAALLQEGDEMLSWLLLISVLFGERI
jgi:hypothetical protein